MSEKNNAEKVAVVQHAMLGNGQVALDKVNTGILSLQQQQKRQTEALSEFDLFLNDCDSLLDLEEKNNDEKILNIQNYKSYEQNSPLSVEYIEKIDIIQFDKNEKTEEFYAKYENYAVKHNIDLNRPLSALLGYTQIEHLKEQLEKDFTYKNAACDKYDYLIAGICGVIGALIDVFGVGAPGEGPLGKTVDDFFDKGTQKIAKWNGWPGPKEGKNPTASAIHWLETHFKVPYDHGTSAATGRLVKNMSLKNHHVKSLAHSPDPIGLLFSIIDQFNQQGTFISNGKLIPVKTSSNGKFKLQGRNNFEKIICGIINWFMHLTSDVAGSSGSVIRGSGIPAPFYNLLLTLNIGSFGKDHQSLAVIFTKLFENGYDLRHVTATIIPVATTELLIRIFYTLKRHYYHKLPWNSCIPSASSPELRRMLFVGHGILCTGDSIDAYVRSGGELLMFLRRTNFTAWMRFTTLAYKEFISFINQGNIDTYKIDIYIENEYKHILSQL